jgi:signal transduction histidine kinase
MNLLLNALDATAEGGNIVVRAELEPDEGGEGVHRLRLQVADSGVGIAAGLEVEGRIYQPFVSTKETGLGLGLPICKQIVEAHGGQLHAANRPGGGAVFTVRLPLGNPAAVPGDPPGVTKAPMAP